MAEDLPKLETLYSAITTRVVDTLRALVNDDEQALDEHLTLDGQTVEDYLMSWQWNSGKYRTDKSLNEIVEMLTKEMQSIDHVMKQKLAAYNAAKGQLQQLERKKHGNLTVCSLADIVHKDDIVDPNSEFLVTLLVVVPKYVCHVLTQKQYTGLAQQVRASYVACGPSLIVPAGAGRRVCALQCDRL